MPRKKWNKTFYSTGTVVTHPENIKKPGHSTGGRPKLVIEKPENNFHVVQHILGKRENDKYSLKYYQIEHKQQVWDKHEKL